MPDLVRAFCPIDGLLLGQKVINNALQNSMGNASVREHADWTMNGLSLSCTNGHTWEATGRIEVRWEPGGTSG
jgi:hypothetical protein